MHDTTPNTYRLGVHVNFARFDQLGADAIKDLHNRLTLAVHDALRPRGSLTPSLVSDCSISIELVQQSARIDQSPEVRRD